MHKTEAKAVVLDLADGDEVAAACAELAARLGASGEPPTGYLVQEQVATGVETIFGVATDPRYGPVLMFGLGGKYVEVMGDVRFGVPPMSRAEALDVVRGIRGVQRLDGVRGEAGADSTELAEILLRLAQLVERHPEIVELDINPFFAAPDGRSRAVDVRVRLAAAALP